MTVNIKGKSNDELLNELDKLGNTGDHPDYKKIELAIAVNCTKELSKLSSKLYFLNWVLSIATVIIAITGIVALCSGQC